VEDIIKKYGPQEYNELLVLEGKPEPWTAPRVFGTTVYDKKNLYKQNSIIKIQSQARHSYCGPIKLDFLFLMPIPNSTPKKNREKLENTFHLKRPDGTNLMKLHEDILVKAGVLPDDNLVCSGSFKKLYAKKPKTIIFITMVGEK
jgi:Holliday junction resolvase RusA-like endonuclease